MVRYHNFDIVFAEIPCETTLAINITNCPNRCRGCHSLHLQADMGRVLDEAEPGSSWAIGTELNLVRRLANAHADKQVSFLDRSVCYCSTMNRMSGRGV